ncbi:3-deoxy-D-manno-octulosonic acid kinase [Vibrio sp. 1159]|uniref:3-deoxy-D-manno-octulosonic acid kinase n=1 Tax=unclassified Vibrio TaxID=2614977 RepID=UPI0004004C4C|nr:MULTISPECIES: 3-deoxy-D-manno-octulosonic acid kinase [Vibrio]MDW2318771.1 3-deoxy-D-manno-octulosonic acid kinase [Vibrio sp. 1159]MDW2402488.1 3-deoxy-D-manno-octulosonic acid kinase [Vibrio sp. 1262-1]HCG7365727.1 3-deoxy-D-manno-octulosonic acid kinase [Vibrio parahaemolyticus]
MIQQYQDNNQVIWFDDEFITNPSQSIFDPEYWQSVNKIVGSATGRGTTWFVQLDTMQAALRHYRRGGLFGKLVKDQYWFSGWDKTRSAEEFQLLLTLIKAGVNVPRPIAARAVKSGLSYQADLLSERIPNARDLVSILQERSLSEDMYKKIGQEIAKMHNAGVNHTDLNIHNILIDDRDKVWIIDFDKCHLDASEQVKQYNLERFKRSFIKECNKLSIHWTINDFATVLKGYELQLQISKNRK